MKNGQVVQRRRINIRKKLTSILVLCIMALMFTLPVSASQTASEGIQPRIQECGGCGKMSLHNVKIGTRKGEATKADCIHGLPFGEDSVTKVYNIYQYQCSNCSYRSSTQEIFSHTIRDCHGYYPR
jgi:hypothetical protein